MTYYDDFIQCNERKKNIKNVLTIFAHTMTVNGVQNKVTKCIVLEQHQSE